jgi:hypothetical protein
MRKKNRGKREKKNGNVSFAAISREWRRRRTGVANSSEASVKHLLQNVSCRIVDLLLVGSDKLSNGLDAGNRRNVNVAVDEATAKRCIGKDRTEKGKIGRKRRRKC